MDNLILSFGIILGTNGLRDWVLNCVCCKNYFSHGFEIVYCENREKKVYFASVKFDAREKRGQQSHE